MGLVRDLEMGKLDIHRLKFSIITLIPESLMLKLWRILGPLV